MANFNSACGGLTSKEKEKKKVAIGRKERKESKFAQKYSRGELETCQNFEAGGGQTRLEVVPSNPLRRGVSARKGGKLSQNDQDIVPNAEMSQTIVSRLNLILEYRDPRS